MIEAIPAFLAALDSGSIQGAARQLNLARPTVRRRIEELEAEVGVALLARGPDGLRPTPAGEVFAQRARELMAELDGLGRAARSIGASPHGVLRIGVPAGMPADMVAEMTNAVGSLWPHVQLELLCAVSDDDLMRRVDCRFSLELAEPVGDVEVVELGVVREQLVASRAYLEGSAPIETLADLAQHRLFCWSAPDTGTPSRLPVLHGVPPRVRIAMATTDMDALVRMACRDLGIVFVPFEPVLALLPPYAPAELTPVLPDIVGRERPRRLVVPKALAGAPVVRAFVEQTRAVNAALFGAGPSKAVRYSTVTDLARLRG